MSMGFFRRSRIPNSVGSDPIRSKFELVRALIPEQITVTNQLQASVKKI